MYNEGAIIKLRQGLQALQSAVKDVDARTLVYKPLPEVWNIGEVLEHIFIVEYGSLRILKLAPTQTSGNINNHHEIIGEDAIIRFLNSPARYAAPEGVHPKGRFETKEQVMAKFADLRLSLIAALEAETIIFGSETYRHPLLGDMTKKDWLHFIALHSDRHLLQIERLKTEALSARS